jgi:hypothetical protein
VRVLAGELLAESALDFLDMSLWQVMKEPEEETFKDRRLIDWFADIPRGRTRLGVAGHIRTPREAQQAIDLGADSSLSAMPRSFITISPCDCGRTADLRPCRCQ